MTDGGAATGASANAGAWTGRRVLVTGGSGFIGSHVVTALVRAGADEVRVLDDHSNGHEGNLREARSLAGDRAADRVTLHVGDLGDASLLDRVCEGVDAVLHQAAIASVPRSVDEPVRYLDVNATGTLRLLLAARRAGVRRVVVAGSSSFYGDQPGFPRVESMAPDMRSPYAAAKGAGEFLARAEAAAGGVDTVSLRYFNIFGPRQRPDSPYAAVIPRFAVAMLRGEPIRLHGDGEQTRDFTYVANAVHANLLAAAHPEPLRGAVLNVAAGQRRTVRDLIERLAARCGTDPVIETAPPRPGEVRHSGASIDLARATIGYEPVADFDDGLARTVDWCRQWLAEHGGDGAGR